MNDLQPKQAIASALKDFSAKPLAQAAIALFESLGYRSTKRLALTPNTPANFLTTFEPGRKLNSDQALLPDWQSVDFLFQLTDDEVRAAAAGNQQFLFEAHGRWNGAEINSFLFLAITLAKPHYTRTELSGITRAVNRLFPMPAMLLFRHGDTLTLAVIPRRLHKRDESKDVLEKVTLIKDIRFANPHRAHVEILADLSFEALHEKHGFTNFVALQAAWQKALDSSELNKRFFQEMANWYFWALDHAKFPKDAPKQDAKDHISVIRLITRLMFCWFVKEKGLIPDTLFDERKLAQTLNGFAPSKTTDKESVFYKAILQNLFFATLNTEMDKRGWTKEEQNFMAHSLYRFRESFQRPNEALDLFKNIPFLNGGLFECLDKDLGENAKPRYVRIDGFSRREDSQPTVPDFLFFGAEREVDLSEYYGDTKFKKVKVRGLIHTFGHYKFTIAENTPIEEEIALDPELSGKVFENLLAAYNPETGATARKQTGSFYTPREIVNYMVDEALIACLESKVAQASSPASSGGVPPPGRTPGETPGQLAGGTPALQAKLRHLFAYNDEPHQFTAPEVDALIAAIDSLKSLDPAVGSGAFPMGILHKLVFILGKLDPRNEKWKERQIARVRDTMATAEKIEDATARERALQDLEQQISGINEAFEHNELDYSRKLYLIENSIYGVDIQPIAVQIAKMRFFISLIVDQKIDDAQPNRGVRPLPNLETKFVAANTLIGVERKERQGDLLTEDTVAHQKLKDLRQQLTAVRHRHFLARTPARKAKCRDQDRELREKMSGLLESAGLSAAQSRQLAGWNPYDQNASADFFDAEWMFGVTDGFAVITGNPPYVRHETISDFRDKLAPHYETAASRADLFVFFFERGVRMLTERGVLCYISSNKYFRAAYGAKLRQFLTEKMVIHRIVDFGDAPVFAAIAYASIFAASRGKPAAGHRVRTLTWSGEDDFTDLARRVDAQSSELPQTALKPDGWNFSAGNSGLLEKLRASSTPLKEYVGGRFYYGIKTGLNDAFVIDKETRKRLIAEDKKSAELIRPWLRGRDVKRWQTRWAGLYAIVFPFGFNSELKRYPAVLKHLKQFEADLRKRGQCVSSRGGKEEGQHHWLELDNNPKPSYLEEFTRPKVVIPAIERSCAFAFDDGGFYSNDKTTICVSDEARFLCGLLNSAVIWWVIRQVAAERQNDYYEFKPMYVSRLPIPKATSTEKVKLTSLVDRILAAKKKNADADTSALEREIDQQVYALYGLTPEEIKIVEEASK